jgi:hypothetical protein
MKFQTGKKGVSLYLALIIMFILIAIGLGVSLIIVSQMKMIRGMGDSVVAFYAADTGIENSLYEQKQGGDGLISPPESIGSASYEVNSCGSNCYKSLGKFGIVKRGIEITVSPPSPFDYTICIIDPVSGNCVDPYSDSEPAVCEYFYDIRTQLTPGSTDRSISFYYEKVSGPGDVYVSFDPTGCATVNCQTTATFSVTTSAPGSYVIHFCGHTDIKDKCATLNFDASPYPGFCP